MSGPFSKTLFKYDFEKLDPIFNPRKNHYPTFHVRVFILIQLLKYLYFNWKEALLLKDIFFSRKEALTKYLFLCWPKPGETPKLNNKNYYAYNIGKF